MATIDENVKIMMLKGEPGSSIKSIDKTATSGMTDTYTITLTNGDKQQFNVTNGKDGEKGEDGRGIAKIEKTASTGAVDTYTITYTDDTTSTYEVKNSDEITLQRQIVPSASVEASNIASQPYKAGQYVVVAGVLRKVTSAIAEGNTISDSNSTATTVGVELGRFNVGSSVSKVSFGKNDSNGHFEIWFEGDGFSKCLYFTDEVMGFYDSKTNTSKSVQLS